MRRKLLNLTAALSLVLCIATAAWWVRSYRKQDFVGWSDTTVDGPQAWSSTFWAVSSYCGQLEFYRNEGSAWRQGRDATAGKRFVWRTHDVTAPTRVWFPTRIGPLTNQYNAPLANSNHVGFHVPHWLLGVAAGLTSLLRFGCLLRGRRRPAGACRQCGYDLRATPDRCPECGGVVGQTPAA
jgi:hypothetical protein